MEEHNSNVTNEAPALVSFTQEEITFIVDALAKRDPVIAILLQRMSAARGPGPS